MGFVCPDRPAVEISIKKSNSKGRVSLFRWISLSRKKNFSTQLGIYILLNGRVLRMGSESYHLIHEKGFCKLVILGTSHKTRSATAEIDDGPHVASTPS